MNTFCHIGVPFLIRLCFHMFLAGFLLGVLPFCYILGFYGAGIFNAIFLSLNVLSLLLITPEKDGEKS